MRSNTTVELLLRQIKNDIGSLKKEIFKFVLYGSAAHSENPRDIDIALIVSDNTDLYELSHAISPIIALYTLRSGILITCFPIWISRYNKSGSQFIANVGAHGREF